MRPSTNPALSGGSPGTAFLPREHGATAMLLTPMVCAAVLSREWRWAELATIVAAIAALSAKDPLVVLARQRFVWKQPHPETAVAAKWLAGWVAIVIASGLSLLFSWPIIALLSMGVGVAAFSILAVAVNVSNRQRSTLFQIVSAAALTSGSLAISLSATGRIQPWCWWLWILLAMQATAGILLVHARLDARIALRGNVAIAVQSRRAAQLAQVVLMLAAVAAAVLGRHWIAAALVIVTAGYCWDLREQRDPEALRMPLKRVGQRALALSSIYAVLVVAGLW